MKLSEREQWFIDRVGKRVWRNENNCGCVDCINVHKHGLIIKDKEHAHVLYHIEGESCLDNFPLADIPLKYFDTPEEGDAFELTLNK